MAKIREYTTILGPQTASAITAGTPTDSSDVITKGYLESTFAALTEWGASVDTIAALKAVAAADRTDQQIRAVQSQRQLWQFEASSSATGDDYFVVTPDAGTGRWINITNRWAEFGGTDLYLKIKNDSGLSSDRTLTINVNDADRLLNIQGDLVVETSGATVANTNSGDVTLAAIGSSPNANGATITGQALNLQPASASFGGVVTTGAQTFAGAKTFSNALNGAVANDAATGTAVTLTAPTTMNVRLTSGTLVSIAGIPAPTGVQWFALHNVTGVSVNILNQSVSATAADRIITGTGATVALADGASLLFNYDITTARWRVIGGSGGGGGGSGLSSSSVIKWTADGADAPTRATEFGNEVYVFSDAASQNLYCTVKVPEAYTAGSQIRMYVSAYHQASSATQLLLAQSTLIPHGTAFDNTTNQRTTTNTAQTGASKETTKHALDLTDASGQINGVSVAAGDLIRVRLYRDTDTSTSDLSFIESATEVRFA